jgi:hypothetical protein
MERLFTAAEVEGRMDCYGEFDRNDSICVSYCALNFSCAMAKARFGSQALTDRWDPRNLDMQTTWNP